MCGGKVNSASIRPRILTGHMVMISLISVHGQSEHVWTKDLREHASQGLCRRTFEMTWNGLQGSALHSFTKGRASEKLMSRRVRSSDAKEKTVALWALSSQNLFGSSNEVATGFLRIFACAVPRRTASTALPRRMATPGGHWPRPATTKTRYQAEAGQDIIILSNNYQYTSS